MAKIALLIGVSEYGTGLNPLPGAVKAVEAMQQVLQHAEMGGFDEVKQLLNPNPPVMREAIERLFSQGTKNDLVLLFFSGHIVQDDSGSLYFTTSISCKSSRAELIRVSAISTSFIRNRMSASDCQHQLVILDGYLNRTFAQEMMPDDSPIGISTQLGGDRQTILTSLASIQESSMLEDFDHSVYTRYLAQGIRTGVADLDSDGWISVEELHEYAASKVQIVAPAVKPKLYAVENGYKQLLAKTPIDYPKLKYRKEAENWVKRGEISEAGHYILDNLATSLQLSVEECTAIEAEVLKPDQEYQEKLRRYEQEFINAICNGYPISVQDREKLKRLQKFIGLRHEDTAPIEAQIVLRLDDITETEEITGNSEIVLAGIDKYLESVNLTANATLPEKIKIATSAPTTPTPTVNLPPSSPDAQHNPATPATAPNRFLLLSGIGGLAVLALALGVFNRASVAPPTPRADNTPPSPQPLSSPQPSPTTTNADKIASPTPAPSPSPSPIAPPESKVCMVTVNGNLHSEPTLFRDNVVAVLRESLPVTGKQTEAGWVEVKMPNSQLAWAYPEIISNKTAMDSCLSKQKIPVKKIKDIPPPGQR